jgi:NAD(P)H dehydrogenase (quinone)
MNIKRSILVTGAGGALGHLTIADLAASGYQVYAGTRDPGRIAHRLPAGATARLIDFDDPPSLDEGFRGVDGLLIISTDELAIPGRRQRQHQAALTAARAAGVSFIAYTSMPDPSRSKAIPFAPDHEEMERSLRESAISHGVLRNSWYQENLLAYLPHIIADGRWFTAAADGRLPYVSRADAASAAASLLEREERGVFDIAGPEMLTVDAIASAVSQTFGLSLEVVHTEKGHVADELARQGVAPAIIPMIASTEAHQRGGGFDAGDGDASRLIGRPLRPLTVFLRANSAALLAHAR